MPVIVAVEHGQLVIRPLAE
ncbi:hypothetical protein [Rosenbergiella nectarea]|nr:hypothetical protein [Rosenbergiella nectarea]